MIDSRFLQNAGLELFTGNELLVKGAMETEGGVHLFTGCPAPPLGELFNTLATLRPWLSQRRIEASTAANETLALSMLAEARMAGARALAALSAPAFASAMHVLSHDAFASGSSGGAAVILCGDDPWAETAMTPADSRFSAQQVCIPMVEPSNLQELKDWIDLAFKLGRSGQIPVGYLVNCALADGGGTVRCRPNHDPRPVSRSTEATESMPQPFIQTNRRVTIERRLATVKHLARQMGINRILHKPQKGELVPLGLIGVGQAYDHLAGALAELGLGGQLPILKLGLSFPVDEQILTEFTGHCQMVVVIEERRPLVEQQVHHALGQNAPEGGIWGKRFPEPLLPIPESGLSASILIEHLVPLIRHHARSIQTNGQLEATVQRMAQTAASPIRVATRSATFCPGCPHRDSASALLEMRRDLLDAEYMHRIHNRKPVELAFHGDGGCSSLAAQSPFNLLDARPSHAGLAGGRAGGAGLHSEAKQVVFMGDGQFEHSGLAAIRQSIHHNQDVTYIILDNRTAAGSRHPWPLDSEVDLLGRPVFAQSIERIVEGMIPRELTKQVQVVRINPADRQRYRKLVEEMVLGEGVQIVIADKECGITFHRRAQSDQQQATDSTGFLPKATFMQVAESVCEFCLACTRETGCPALGIVSTEHGPKIQTDLSSCVNDGACARIDACPAFEQVTVFRQRPPRDQAAGLTLENLPEPPIPIHGEQETWRCCVSGVGGMGVSLLTAVLATAGHQMGYRVQFRQHKGFAVRTGSVLSHLLYTRLGKSTDRRPDGFDTADPIEPPLPANAPYPTNRPQPPEIATAAEHSGGETLPLAPYGMTDLLLGVDLLEAARALDAPHRVALTGHTAAVLNTAATATMAELSGHDPPQPQELEAALKEQTHDRHYFAVDVAELCQRLLGDRIYTNIMLLGIAFQKGFLPLRRQELEEAIRHVAPKHAPQNLRAFKLGRVVVLSPDLVLTQDRDRNESVPATLRRKVEAIRRRHGGRTGHRLCRHYRRLLASTFRQIQHLHSDKVLIRQLIVATYDCLNWGGLEYAQRYCRRIAEVFAKDDPDKGYALTRAVVRNLARTMLIKDEFYVATLLCSPEKRDQDHRRFNINPDRGDRMVTRHLLRPEFELFGLPLRIQWRCRNWHLRVLARLSFLRRLGIGRHKRQRAFRDWYENLVDQLDWDSLDDPRLRDRNYHRWLAILESPHDVNGFAALRHGKMEAARQRAQRCLATDPELFEPAPSPGYISPSPPGRTVHLPVVHSP